mmetsp:Transcript_499/g.591  ORF Transcript_499/g.591 Transcript_499/m.591 type:complete len:311 (-) Transcript_499:1173-2105(-)|eukprot:CAMPEP_0184025222 /NCGR_PEP_ID=MMETSP0954-20121128/12654_1 /TAXON_ID=627963 /ORGANISM="Aplanochytrium sp, Strain PBS07" /LENGTH=310 /DNA_ID=CAMNT_0026308909 /DNA_START=311 /DNA_END=1243 /DNA_ORIENTATION=-
MSTPIEMVLRRQASRRATQAGKVIQKEARALRERGLPFNKKRLLPFIAPIAGFSSAFLEISILFPMEYCKVQLQLNRKNKDFKLGSHLRSRGLKIYQGLPPMLIGAPIQGLLRFSCLDFFARQFSGMNPVLSGLFAGCAAGVLESVLVVTPMETVKTKLIDSNKGLLEGVKYIVGKHGVRGLYNGLAPTILKSSSNQGLRFIIYNTYKSIVAPEGQQLSAMQSLSGGMLAGVLGCYANTPFDTIKSRMQGMEGARYNGVLHCAKTMIKEEGALSLYKGVLMRAARVVPGQGIIFLAYDQLSDGLTRVLEA